MREYMDKYVREGIPRKTYTRKISIRQRKPFEIFWQEIFIVLFVLFMLYMLYANYQSNLLYSAANNTAADKEVDIRINIIEENRLSSDFVPEQIEKGSILFYY